MLYNCCMEKEKLKTLLQARGISMYQMAKDLDVHPNVVTNWFYRSGIPKKRLKHVSNYFGVSVDYFL